MSCSFDESSQPLIKGSDVNTSHPTNLPLAVFPFCMKFKGSLHVIFSPFLQFFTFVGRVRIPIYLVTCLSLHCFVLLPFGRHLCFRHCAGNEKQMSRLVSCLDRNVYHLRSRPNGVLLVSLVTCCISPYRHCVCTKIGI